jgi:hypothetical protein
MTVDSFSILCPTRGRPEGALELCNTVFNNASGKYPVQILFRMDNDDPTADCYTKVLSKHQHRIESGEIQIIVGKQKSISIMYNDLADLSTGSLLMIANDDLVFLSRRWDEIIETSCRNLPHDCFCVFGHDGTHNGKPVVNSPAHPTIHVAFPNITRTLYCLSP